jgi:hypothetical protein
MTHICNITSEYEYVSSIVNYQYDIGDEFHYIMSCNYLKRERGKYLPSYCCNNLMSYFLRVMLLYMKKTCKFIKIYESPASSLI